MAVLRIFAARAARRDRAPLAGDDPARARGRAGRPARARGPGGRRGAPPHRARPARRRPAAARRARPVRSTWRAGSSPPIPSRGRPDARNRARAGHAGRRSELRELARGLHPVGLERGLEIALASLACSPRCRSSVARCPTAGSPRWSRRRSGSSSPKRSRTRSSTRARPSVRVASAIDGALSPTVVTTTARAAPTRARAPGCSGCGARRGARRHASTVDSPAGAGTRLRRTIPLAPWRTPREPFLEFGLEGDGGTGRAQHRAGAGRRAHAAVSLAREWELEGGPPRPGQVLPVLDHHGRRHGRGRGRARGRRALRRGRRGRRPGDGLGEETWLDVRPAAPLLRGVPRRDRASARRAGLAASPAPSRW